MNNSRYKYISWFSLAVAVILFVLSLTVNRPAASSDRFAGTLEKRLEKRMKILEQFALRAMEEDREQWLELKNLPKDMVVYRYEYDTLQSWCNQFPVINDNIGRRMVFHTLANLRSELVSPLTNIGREPTYINLGQKWYIAKYMSDGIKCKIIYGLEIKDDFTGNITSSKNGINPALKVPDKYNILPLNYSGGSAVSIGGVPVIKIVAEISKASPVSANVTLRWLALLFVAIAVMTSLLRHKTLTAFALEVLFLLLCSTISYIWGHQLQYTSVFFSPTIYADGVFLNSFGSLMIINIFVCSVIFCLYSLRKKLIVMISGSGHKKIIYGISIVSLIIVTGFYLNYSLVSLIKNSSITLDLYNWYSLSWYSLFTYISYFLLFYSVLLLVQLLRPVVSDLFGVRYNVFSRSFLFASATVFAVYLTYTAGHLGFQKELHRVNVWTNRLAVERDLALEIQLKSIEEAIASDHVIATLVENDGADPIIIHRLNENYLFGISQDYEVTISLSNENSRSTYNLTGEPMPTLEYFSRKMSTASAISGSNHFVYLRETNGESSYIGTFVYYSERSGLTHMFIEIRAKAYRNDTGYSNILYRLNKPDEVSMPQFYSYAKYISGNLVSFRGNYPYPTVMGKEIEATVQNGIKFFRSGKHIHFVNTIPTDEVIIISRGVRGVMTYFITFSYLVIILFIIFMVTTFGAHRKKTGFMRNYYRSSINMLLFLALFLTLIIMAFVSVTFVFTRNKSNVENMMSSKINTIQALMEARCRGVKDFRDIANPEFVMVMENIASTTESDITLFTPSGKAFRSTAPEVFDRMLVGFRMDQDAYYNIKYRNQRFYIGREEIAGRKFYSLYAPIMNDAGQMIAILNSPYTDQSAVFKRDAFFHGATIISLFIILLFGTLFVSTTVVNAMFKPLLAIGKKMESTDIQSLDYISYNRKDEISNLVEAYNKMARDLSESTKKLAQSERDQAWSEMARQVAHEIKNPLTPIKLEIQRLIRLKERNDPAWNEKFDKVASVVLEHIDILTDTANEFSTFAKLYSEEPVALNLDAVLRDQILIFDNKDNIDISYIGTSEAWVEAPKPQLIRVFVNLITNAVQAIEIMQKDMVEQGEVPIQGKILIALRNSVKDGYYDVAFDDNGPGVSEQNRDKLFTPNFTTKSAGTGLGLAICRNIIEKCEGEIFYQKSFAFGGACFLVRLPKMPHVGA